MEWRFYFRFDFVKSRKPAGPQKQRSEGMRQRVAFVGGSGALRSNFAARRSKGLRNNNQLHWLQAGQTLFSGRLFSQALSISLLSIHFTSARFTVAFYQFVFPFCQLALFRRASPLRFDNSHGCGAFRLCGLTLHMVPARFAFAA